MKNRDVWQPSKFVYKKGKLVASRDTREIGVASRLVADIVAGLYEKYLKQYARGRLLDLGCGSVPLYESYKGYVTDNICVDWANTRHKNHYLDVECDLTKDLPFGDGEFDTIILSDVLEHIPEPQLLWKEMSRVLSKDGRVIVNVPFFYCIHEAPHDYYRYTEFALRRFVEKSGLRLILLEAVGGSPEILADIFSKHLQFIPVIGKGMAIITQYLTRLFVRTSSGRMISGKSSQAFPFGYFLIAEKAG